MEKDHGFDITKMPSALMSALASVVETVKPDILTEIWVSDTPAYDELETADGAPFLCRIWDMEKNRHGL